MSLYQGEHVLAEMPKRDVNGDLALVQQGVLRQMILRVEALEKLVAELIARQDK